MPLSSIKFLSAQFKQLPLLSAVMQYGMCRQYPENLYINVRTWCRLLSFLLVVAAMITAKRTYMAVE